jgi:hypothetical protein
MRTAVVLVVRLTASRRTVFDGVGEPAGSGRALRPGERCPEFAGTDGAGRRVYSSARLGSRRMDVQTLSSLTSLMSGPILLRRREITRGAVLLAATRTRNRMAFSIDEVLAVASADLGIKITRAAAMAALDDLIQTGDISGSPLGTLSVSAGLRIPTLLELTEPVWEEFLPIFRSTDKNAELNTLHDAARHAFDKVVTDLMARLADSNLDLAAEVETLPISDIYGFVKASVAHHPPPQPESFSKALADYLRGSKPAFSQFLFQAYQGLINLDILTRETNLQGLVLTQTVDCLLLDTNVLAALLCEADPVHALATAVTERTAQLGTPVGYSDLTEREMWRFVDGSRAEMAALSVSGGVPVVQSQFVEDSLARGIPWGEYADELVKWRLNLAERWGVRRIRTIQQLDDRTYEYARVTLPILTRLREERRAFRRQERTWKSRSHEAIDHDARVLAWIALSRREADEATAKGPWFLTLDSVVTALSESGKAELGWGEGLAVQPRLWLNYLLAYTPTEFDASQRRTVAEALIRFTARVRRPPLTLREYTKLLAPKLGLTDADAPLLYEALFKHPLRHALEVALDADRGTESESIVREVISDASYIASFTDARETRERLSKVGPQVQAAEGRIRELEAEIRGFKASSGPARVEVSAVATAQATSVAGGGIDFEPLVALLERLRVDGLDTSRLPRAPAKESSRSIIVQWLGEVGDVVRASGLAPPLIRLVEGFIGHLLGGPPPG